MTRTWQQFVAAAGARTLNADLAAVVGQPVAAIARVRAHCAPTGSPQRFVDLFTAWHGRPPRDEEWPAPRRQHHGYTWTPPELALLASLVGRLGPNEIAKVLTARLRKVTGDGAARRTRNSILVGMQRAGLQSTDVVGGITIPQAVREVGVGTPALHHDIRGGKLKTIRVGRLHVIPHAEWAAWKARRVQAPPGFVRLTSLKRPLGIRSDKLSEWARLGYVPTAVRCNPYGGLGPSTKFGTWWIDAKVAKQLITDRRAGRPMPWHGKPEPYNLRVTWRLYQKRRHPAQCTDCRDIWGEAGAPRTFEDYVRRYPPLAMGAKRHLTWTWTPGLTPQALAARANVEATHVRRAIRNGVLRADGRGARLFIRKTDAARWIARHCPTGETPHGWMTFHGAKEQYDFSRAELVARIRRGELTTRIETNGPARGQTLMVRQQLRELRDRLGYTEAQAAKRAHVSIARWRVLVRGTTWREASGIPRHVIETVIKRKYSRHGMTIPEAAAHLGKSIAWVNAEVKAGTIRLLRVHWDKQRRYVSAPMLARLVAAAKNGRRRRPLSADWMLCSAAAQLAGVSPATLMRWADAKRVVRRMTSTGWRYHRQSVMSQARRYWPTARWRRDQRPEWLKQEAA